jgi:hypothetical protein
MLLELEELLDEFVLEPPEDEPPEAWVDWLLDVVDEPELEEFEPQAATPRAISTSRAAVRRRGDLVIDAFIITPVVQTRGNPRL